MCRMDGQAQRSNESQLGVLNVGAGIYYSIKSNYNHFFIAPPLTNYSGLGVRSI